MSEAGAAPARTWRWAGALAVASALALLAAEAHGRGERLAFHPPEGFSGTWAAVPDVAGAARVWEAGGVSGRRLVVLTGRWASLAPGALQQQLVEQAGRSFGEVVNPDNALLLAARMGMARSLLVVMPPDAWARRAAELSGQRSAQRSGGCVSTPWLGIERRFCRPEAVDPDGEPSLVLVEPSWFAGPEQVPLDRWLARAGVQVELGLVAADDPTASDAQRAAAEACRARLGAPSLEVGE